MPKSLAERPVSDVGQPPFMFGCDQAIDVGQDFVNGTEFQFSSRGDFRGIYRSSRGIG